MLPRNAGGEEDASFPVLGVSYPNDALQALTEVVDRFLRDEAELDEVEEKMLIIEQRLATLLENLQPTLEALKTGADGLNAGDLSPQVAYLIEVGVSRFNDAIDGLYQALDQEDAEAIEPLLAELAVGNSYICHAGTLLTQVLNDIDRAIAHRREPEPG